MRSRSRPASETVKRCRHDQRSFAAATAAATSKRAACERPALRSFRRARSAATCSCASRNGTPSLDQRFRRVGGEEERVGSCGGEAPVVELEPGDEDGERAERARDVAARGEHRRLVLLQVAVVRERQRLHRREQAGQAADRRARLAACELGDVGVQLLRHDRRPGRRFLGKPREAELARRPEHELLADPREVDEERRGRVEVVEREVAIGDRIDRVAHRVRRRRERQRRAGERAGTERRRCRLRGREREPRAVALEHLDPREQVVADRHRLRPLQMGVPGHRRLRPLPRRGRGSRARSRRAPHPPRRTRRAT